MKDKGGSETEIKQLPTDQPNVGLGCRLAPDGNQSHECTTRLNQCREFDAKVSTATLKVDEMYQYLLTWIIPAVCYAIEITDIPIKVAII